MTAVRTSKIGGVQADAERTCRPRTMLVGKREDIRDFRPFLWRAVGIVPFTDDCHPLTLRDKLSLYQIVLMSHYRC